MPARSGSESALGAARKRADLYATRGFDVVNPRRVCPECGQTFVAKHGRQTFCCPAHQQAFHDRNKTRGKALLPLLLVWRRAKKRKGDKAAAYAFAQICGLGDIWNAEDREAGRRPDIIVDGRMDAGWIAADL